MPFLAETASDEPATPCTNCNLTEPNFNDSYKDMCVFDTSEDILSSTAFQVFIYFMYSTVFVVALLGNGLVCFVVQTTPRMKTVTNYFIVNLAVGDVLMTLFCVPFSFVSMLALRYWPFGSAMCKIVNYSQAVSVLVSAYTLLAISIDRYMVIMRPLKPRLGKVAAKLVVGGVWCGALATAAPIPIVSQLQRPSPWHIVCESDICGEQWALREQSSQYTRALLALQFALPLAALVCTYARIGHAVWGGRPPGEAQGERDSRMQRSKRKMIKMMVTVVAVFTVSWLPLNVFNVLYMAHASDDEWNRWPGLPYVWFACHWLAMSHSCYNPIIYCYMNARYRRGFRQVLSGMLCLGSSDGSDRFCQVNGEKSDGMAMSGEMSTYDIQQLRYRLERTLPSSVRDNALCVSDDLVCAVPTTVMAAPAKRSDTILENQLLAFVQQKRILLDELSLKNICLTSFKEDEIAAARAMLQETAVTSIRLVARRGAGHGMKDLQDIFWVFSYTDPADIPTYVARDPHKLPPVTFNHVDATGC